MAPGFISAATSADGAQITLSYNETLNDRTAETSAFNVEVNGAAAIVAEVATSDNNIRLGLSASILPSQSVSVSYSAPPNDPSANNRAIQSLSGIDAASLTAVSVTNNSTTPANTALNFAGVNLESVVSARANALASGDINNDGLIDLVVSDTPEASPGNPAPGSVTVLLGDRRGGFIASGTTGVGLNPNSISINDFNRDGYQDLVVANQRVNSQLSVLLGNGTGNFLASSGVDAGPAIGGFAPEPRTVVSSDFNGDGRIDIAWAVSYDNNSVNGNVGIALNNGTNNPFLGVTSNFYSVGINPYGLLAIDIDKDQTIDLISANSPAVGNGSISVLRGNGDGTFQAPVNTAVGARPRYFAAGDYNLDGKLDLALTQTGADNNVSILTGNGTGAFTRTTLSLSSNAPRDVGSADFNRDGFLDIAVATYGGDNAYVFMGNGTGGFATPKAFALGDGPVFIEVADFDRNGFPDIAAANVGSTNASSRSITVLLNTLSRPGARLNQVLDDGDGADNTYEVGKDGNKDGVDDAKQPLVATFQSSTGVPVTISASQSVQVDLPDTTNGGLLKSTAVLRFRGLVGGAEVAIGPVILGLQTLVAQNTARPESPDMAQVVAAVSDQPSIQLTSEVVSIGIVDPVLESGARSTANNHFANTIRYIDLFCEEDSNAWNALFRPDGNGGYFFFGYDINTGLGGMLLDRDNNGRVDGARLYLRDNQLGDLNLSPFVIDARVGLAAITQVPTLRLSEDGLGLIVDGLLGTGLWLNIEAFSVEGKLSNTFEIFTRSGSRLGAIRAQSSSTKPVVKEIYLAAGEEIRFAQSIYNDLGSSVDNIRLAGDNSGFSMHIDDGSNNAVLISDLGLRITGSLTARNPESIVMARLQRDSADALLDFTGIPAAGARLNISILSDTPNTNRFGLVRLEGDYITGYSVRGVRAGNTDAFRNAVRDNIINPGGSVITATGQVTRTITWDLTAVDAGTYAAVLINPNGQVFTFGATASDGHQHVQVLGDNVFGFEDILASQRPDWKYNDFRAQFSFA